MSELIRIEVIDQLLRGDNISSQYDLKLKLGGLGIATTQSSISRDLKKLGVTKVNGHYKPLKIGPGDCKYVDCLDVLPAGDNLLVLRTSPGNAGRAAAVIDDAQIPEILGSIAGDDTIFLAVESKKEHNRVLKNIYSLFLEKGN